MQEVNSLLLYQLDHVVIVNQLNPFITKKFTIITDYASVTKGTN